MRIRAPRVLVAAAFWIGMGYNPAWAQAKPAATAKAPRIIFVVDAENEEPLANAQVRDILTGNAMRTSKDGAVGLFVPQFVKKTGALLEVRMAGYETSDRLYVDPTSDTALVIGLFKVGAIAAMERRPARQLTDSTVFEFVVLDDEGSPLSEANIAILQGVSTVLASQATGQSGFGSIVLRQVTGEVQITIQRVGYAPSKQFYRLGSADTVFAQVAMRRLAQQLAPVNVTAKSDLKRRLQFLNADDIAASKRTLVNGLDVARWVKPEMFGNRTRGIDGHTPGSCGVTNSIWVNGRLIRYEPQGVFIPKTWKPPQIPVTTRGPRGRTYRRPPPQPIAVEGPISDLVRAVLASIKPEHIAEMTYNDCFNTMSTKLHTTNAIFVVLKSGVIYHGDRGSMVQPDTTRSR